MSEYFDVIIVGAGIVGLSLALDLAQAGLKVGLLEKNSIDSTINLDHYDQRVFAINQGSQQWFEALDVWSLIKSYRISPYRAMEVWEGAGQIHFDTEGLIDQILGHIIEQKVMVKSLIKKIQDDENIFLFDDCILSDYQFCSIQTNKCELPLKAPLIIGADGMHSWVAQRAGMSYNGWSYNQSALVALIRLEKSHQQTAWQHFEEQGPLAVLPLADPYHASIVWMISHERAQFLKNLPESEFNRELTRSFGASLGALEVLDPERSVFELTMQHADRYCQPGCVLVGDSAHRIHPMAGLGLNLGLANAKMLASLIKEEFHKKRSLTSVHYLKKYERRARHRALIMIGMMEVFRKFGRQNNFIKYRERVLNQVNNSFIKDLFIKAAMG